jgi:Transposase zinc-binding domain
VIEVAEVFRRFADDYLSAHDAGKPGKSLLPSHRRAITDILACRTEALGGHLWRCDACSSEVYSYHSCKNRSCPKCHTDQTTRWLEARKIEMLPCRYFHITITAPAELREVLRANQRDGYLPVVVAHRGARSISRSSERAAAYYKTCYKTPSLAQILYNIFNAIRRRGRFPSARTIGLSNAPYHGIMCQFTPMRTKLSVVLWWMAISLPAVQVRQDGMVVL